MLISIVRNQLIIPIKSLKPISYTFALSFPHYNVINPAYKFKILKKKIMRKNSKFEIKAMFLEENSTGLHTKKRSIDSFFPEKPCHVDKRIPDFLIWL